MFNLNVQTLCNLYYVQTSFKVPFKHRVNYLYTYYVKYSWMCLLRVDVGMFLESIDDMSVFFVAPLLQSSVYSVLQLNHLCCVNIYFMYITFLVHSNIAS